MTVTLFILWKIQIWWSKLSTSLLHQKKKHFICPFLRTVFEEKTNFLLLVLAWKSPCQISKLWNTNLFHTWCTSGRNCKLTRVSLLDNFPKYIAKQAAVHLSSIYISYRSKEGRDNSTTVKVSDLVAFSYSYNSLKKRVYCAHQLRIMLYRKVVFKIK